MNELLRGALLVFSAFGAGAINSLAGGGTLITFPALIWSGFDPKFANATSTVALWPGTLGGAYGFRNELKTSRLVFLKLLAPSLAGGALGALLLQLTPSATFRFLVPFLIWAATAIFAAQKLISGAGDVQEGSIRKRGYAVQFLGSVYGGYFGAGLGIITLAALRLCGVSDLHRANGLKSLLGAVINGTAVLLFALGGLVDWSTAGMMAGGALLGGYAGARLAKRIGRQAVQKVVIVLGVGLGAVALLRL